MTTPGIPQGNAGVSTGDVRVFSATHLEEEVPTELVHRVSGYRRLVLFWGKITHWVEEANLQYGERLLKLTRNAYKLSFVHHVMESAGYRPLCPVWCL